MSEHDPHFISAAQRLLFLMSARRLSTPLAISWRDLYGSPPTLHVHIEPENFRQWVDELDGAVYSNDENDDEHTRHMHAEGALRVDGGVRVHVVAVTLVGADA